MGVPISANLASSAFNYVSVATTLSKVLDKSTIPAFSQLLRHCMHPISSGDRFLRNEVTIWPLLEKARSGSSGIACIANTSIASCDRQGNALRMEGNVQYSNGRLCEGSQLRSNH